MIYLVSAFAKKLPKVLKNKDENESLKDYRLSSLDALDAKTPCFQATLVGKRKQRVYCGKEFLG